MLLTSRRISIAALLEVGPDSSFYWNAALLPMSVLAAVLVPHSLTRPMHRSSAELPIFALFFVFASNRCCDPVNNMESLCFFQMEEPTASPFNFRRTQSCRVPQRGESLIGVVVHLSCFSLYSFQSKLYLYSIKLLRK